MVSFSNLKKPEPDTALVVDALNLAFRYMHSGERNFADKYISTISSLANSYCAGRIILACDFGSSSYRRELLPSYKGARKEKFQNQSDEEREKMQNFFADFEEALVKAEQHFTVLRYKNVEADDLAAWVVANRASIGIKKIWLISSDKDWDLLVNSDVSRFSTVTRKEITADNWDTHYDVPQAQYVSYKCLIGDSGDSVPGIEGIGPKRATALLQDYPSAMDLVDNLPIPGKAKYIQAVNASADLIMLNYQLMDLLSFHEDAIGADNIKDLQERLYV